MANWPLRRGVFNYDGGAELTQALRDQIVALSPEYIDSNARWTSDVAYLIQNLPSCRVVFYNSLTDDSAGGAEEIWLDANKATYGVASIEDCYLHFYNDTVVSVGGGANQTIKGWGGPNGTAATRREARIPVYNNDRSRVVCAYHTAAVRQLRRQYDIATLQTPVAPGLYWGGVYYDNAISRFLQVDLAAAGSQVAVGYGQIAEDPAHAVLNTTAMWEWYWWSGAGLHCLEFRQHIATNPSWLGGRQCKIVGNCTNIPSIGDPNWLKDYVYLGNGSDATRHPFDAACLEYQFSPLRNDGQDLPKTIFDTCKVASLAGLDVWSVEYIQDECWYPNDTFTVPNVPSGNDNTRTAAEGLMGVLAQHWVYRSNGNVYTGFMHSYVPKPASHQPVPFGDGTCGISSSSCFGNWQHVTRLGTKVDLGAAKADPFVLFTGQDPVGQTCKVWAREFDNGLAIVRERTNWNDRIDTATAITVTLPTGQWEPVDIDGVVGSQVPVWPLKSGGGQIFRRVSTAPSDTTAPGQITDLTVTATGQSRVNLRWTDTGDDGASGTATSIQIRRSSSPIVTTTDWANATVVTPATNPLASGTVRTYQVKNLAPGTTYYFAIRATDDAGNQGAVSNSPAGTTLAGTDQTPPSRVTDFAVVSNGAPGVFVSPVRGTWTAPGDDGSFGTAAAYEMRWSYSPLVGTSTIPIVCNGTLTPASTAQVKGNYLQAIPSIYPSGAMATLRQSGSTYPMAHFVNPATPTYAACFSAIAGACYQHNNNTFSNGSEVIPEDVADGSFGTPSGAATITGDHATRTFSGAVVHVNLNRDQAITVSGVGSIPALGAVIVWGTGPVADGPGQFPRRGGIFWGDCTPDRLALIAEWSDVVLNDSQVNGPLAQGASPTPVADILALNASCRVWISRNGWNVFVDASGNPSVYWPGQQRLHTFAQAHNAWLYENGQPITDVFVWGRVRYFDMTNEALQDFLADDDRQMILAAGAFGLFIDEGHSSIESLRTVHPSVPEDAAWESGMVRFGDSFNSDFTTGTSVASMPSPAAAGTAQSKDFSLRAGRSFYLALRAQDEAGNWSLVSNQATITTGWDDQIAPTEVADLAIDSVTQTTAIISWSSPSELDSDDNSIPATAYDIRYSTSAITSGNFNSATPVLGVPVPETPDTGQSMTVSGLTQNTTYHFAMKSRDAVGNWSDISNVPSATTLTSAPPPDTTAPAAITDLSSTGRTSSSVALRWTATGDDVASGTAAVYDVRYSTALIDSSNFATATQVGGEPAPLPAGSVQSFTVTGLIASTSYYFAIKVADEAGNWSTISNVLNRTTLAPPADTTPPSDVDDLVAVLVTPTSAALQWTAPGDDQLIGQATSYEIRYSTSDITAFSFGSATIAVGAPSPGAFGSQDSMVINGLEPGTTYYVALRAFDEIGNGSGISNVVQFTTPGENQIELDYVISNEVELTARVQ